MPKGHPLTITRADVEPYWNDPDLRMGDITQRLGCGREALRRRAVAWGLPPRPKAKRKSTMSLVGQRGHPLTISREELEPLWFDTSRSIKAIAEHFHVSDRALYYYAPRLGLPSRSELKGQWRVGNCDKCEQRPRCNELQATGERFPCQPVRRWDADEMAIRRDGDRVGSSNFGAAGRVRLGGRNE